jgi:hypothetical protein
MKPKRLHLPKQATLMVADSGELGRDAVAVPAKGRPVCAVVYIYGLSPHHVRRLGASFAAQQGSSNAMRSSLPGAAMRLRTRLLTWRDAMPVRRANLASVRVGTRCARRALIPRLATGIHLCTASARHRRGDLSAIMAEMSEQEAWPLSARDGIFPRLRPTPARDPRSPPILQAESPRPVTQSLDHRKVLE